MYRNSRQRIGLRTSTDRFELEWVEELGRLKLGACVRFLSEQHAVEGATWWSAAAEARP
jgi:hypothetical protein